MTQKIIFTKKCNLEEIQVTQIQIKAEFVIIAVKRIAVLDLKITKKIKMQASKLQIVLKDTENNKIQCNPCVVT